MATLTLAASKRAALGKRAKTVLADHRIPAIVYGHGAEPRPISVPMSEFRRVYSAAGSSALIDLTVDEAAPVKSLIKEVQYHPTRHEPVHIDFQQINMKEKMRLMVPLVFTGESGAVKTLGGTLVKSLDHLEIECLPADLPHEITVDIGGLNTFEDSITVADLNLPKGVQALTGGELTIATVERPLTEEELKKLEESQVGDVTAVKSEAEEKKAEKEAEAAAAGTEGTEAKTEK